MLPCEGRGRREGRKGCRSQEGEAYLGESLVELLQLGVQALYLVREANILREELGLPGVHHLQGAIVAGHHRGQHRQACSHRLLVVYENVRMEGRPFGVMNASLFADHHSNRHVKIRRLHQLCRRISISVVGVRTVGIHDHHARRSGNCVDRGPSCTSALHTHKPLLSKAKHTWVGPSLALLPWEVAAGGLLALRDTSQARPAVAAGDLRAPAIGARLLHLLALRLHDCGRFHAVLATCGTCKRRLTAPRSPRVQKGKSIADPAAAATQAG